MVLQIALRGTDERVALCFADPEVLREGDGVDIHCDGNDEAENKNNDVSAALVQVHEARR